MRKFYLDLLFFIKKKIGKYKKKVLSKYICPLGLSIKELDGVGPVDNRPSTDKLHHFVKKKKKK